MPRKAEPQGLKELLTEELQDLYDAEKQLVKALPKMAKASSDEELENALREHLEITKGQVSRLEQVFESMDMRARSKPCKGMKGLVEEGQEMIQEEDKEMILDSALAASCRKVEHYEMVGYESVRSMAQQLGMKEAAQLLGETLQEEMQADKLLAQISKRLLKEASSREAGMGEEEEDESSGRQTRGRGTSSGRSASARGRSQSSGASSRGQSQSSGRSSSNQRSSSRGGSSGGGNSRSSKAGGSRGATARPLTDHEEIRQWAEERGATPTCVRGTGGKGDVGMLRLDFPGYSGQDSLQPIDWDEWFQRFDERDLALLVQDKTARGQKSNFNKLVSRQGAERPRSRAAR